MLTERDTITLFLRFALLIATATIAICGAVAPKPRPSLAGHSQSRPGSDEAFWVASDGTPQGAIVFVAEGGR